MTHNIADRKVTISYDPVFHIIIDNFWGKEASQEILNHIETIQNHFEPPVVFVSQDTMERITHRTNLSCYIDKLYPRWAYNGSWEKEFEDWPRRKQIRAQASPLLRRVDNMFEGNDEMLNVIMDQTPFPFSKFRMFDIWETQVSRYGGEPETEDEKGQFYTWHIDRVSGHSLADARVVSMVYYVHSEPRRFEGGNIALSNGVVYDDKLVTTTATTTAENNNNNSSSNKELEIDPRNDRLLIFSSRSAHTVRPTKIPKNTPFRDARFSINIWSGRIQYLNPGDLL